MTKLEERVPHSDWDFLKEKCMDCYNENKKRPNPKKNANSIKVLACPRHAKELRELHALMLKHKLPRLPRSSK